jgi:hypothetical protein
MNIDVEIFAQHQHVEIFAQHQLESMLMLN